MTRRQGDSNLMRLWGGNVFKAQLGGLRGSNSGRHDNYGQEKKGQLQGCTVQFLQILAWLALMGRPPPAVRLIARFMIHG